MLDFTFVATIDLRLLLCAVLCPLHLVVKVLLVLPTYSKLQDTYHFCVKLENVLMQFSLFT